MQMYNIFLNCQLFTARILCFFLIFLATGQFLIIKTLDITWLRAAVARIGPQAATALELVPDAHPYSDEAKRHNQGHYPILPITHHNNMPI